MPLPAPRKPAGLDTPGLKWRSRASGWVAYWVARADIVERGYPLKTQRLWPPSAVSPPPTEPTPTEWLSIAADCQRLQDEMAAWTRNGDADRRQEFDGTLASLIDLYQQDPDSPYHTKRPDTRRGYDEVLRALRSNVGARSLMALTGRDFVRWHREYAAPRKPGGPPRTRWAHGVMAVLRIVLGFGAAFDLPPTVRAQCAALRAALATLRFELPKPRRARLTAAQAEAVRAQAHAAGRPSVALAQALAFELTLRQRDVIGEWVAAGEAGESTITDRGQKWLRGLRWDEISEALILRHTTSKRGQIAEFELGLYPMVMDEIARVPPDRRSGPMVVCETTGLPYRRRHFAATWREIATKAGVPSDVWQMDSRAGGVTEATDAGAAIEDVRHHAQHADLATTQRYSRGTLDKTRHVAILRVAHRATKKPG